MKRALLMLALLAMTPSLAAHELQTVVLRLVELGPHPFPPPQAGEGRGGGSLVQATMKTPLARDGAPAAVVPQFPAACEASGKARAERQPDLILRQWRLHCAGGLAGQRLRIDGLDPRTPDAVVTVRFADGRELTAAVDRHDPVIHLQPAVPGGAPPELIAYLSIGIEHILLGPDHLLFVLGLMLVVAARGRWRSPMTLPLSWWEGAGGRGAMFKPLLITITAFTLAHSLTLALAVLGVWGLPSKPVELLIALSIVLLAYELATYQMRQARGLPPSLTLRKPWLVAFVFGLLHGFGFAGALTQVGLPEQARGWALFLFNVGVEIGQLMFVVVMLLTLTLLRRLHRKALPVNGAAVMVTLLGGIAMYWTLDRLLLWTTSIWAGI